MRKRDRILKIQELIIAQSEVHVADLAELFRISSVTIRNDLDEMAANNKLKRIRGGARLKDSVEQTFFSRSILRPEITDFSADKLYAAQLAEAMVGDGEWIFIGCGDTCAAVAQALLNKRVNVVTNSLLAASILSLNVNATVCVPGGNLSGYDRHFLSGDILNHSMSMIQVKYAFFGVSGAEFSAGFTCSSPYEHGVFEAVRQSAERLVIVMGSEKFGIKSFMRIAMLEDVDLVLSDIGMPDAYKIHFSNIGVTSAVSRDDVVAYLGKIE
ncbi:MAG: DeoR/GlpR family DNA-binding transcription regulator [Synergistaceae bacterium]|jgi:DeoR/GlpR family transcriptional regulator of sugar metabolism|nr:DeoR/GlpR family DNA-binding transcription regulator [Synergistaceae bacterium]